MLTRSNKVLGATCLVLAVAAAWLFWSLAATRQQLAIASLPRVVDTHAAVALRSSHFAQGMPIPMDESRNFAPVEGEKNVPGISVIVHEGHVILHGDRAKQPLLVCEHWSYKSLLSLKESKQANRDFEEDPELPEYARGSDSYNQSAGKFDRGHMAPHEDNRAWGEDNLAMGDRMSNICPQPSRLNSGVWNKLEGLTRRSVSPTLKEEWILCGPIFKDGKPSGVVGNGVWIASGFYKIVAWYDSKKKFHVCAYIFPADCSDSVLEKYQVNVSVVEEQTGFLFFPDLSEREYAMVRSTIEAPPWKK